MRKQSKKDPASNPGRKKAITTTKDSETTSRRSNRGKTTEELMDKMLTDKNAKISDADFKNIMLESRPGEAIEENKPTKSIEKLSKPSQVEKTPDEGKKRDDDKSHVTPWNILGE